MDIVGTGGTGTGQATHEIAKCLSTVRVTVGDDNELKLTPESTVKELEHLSEKD